MAAHPPYPGGTGPGPTRRGNRPNVTVLVALGLLIVSLILFGREGSSPDAAPPPDARHAPQAVTPPPSARASSPSARATSRPLPRSRPVRLHIPKISVDAPFTPLKIGATGQLEAPPPNDVNLVGWHSDGATPGESGTAIIAGHVDTATSPAVFAQLGALAKGDVFDVVRADGRKANFVVDDVETFAKDDFPDKRVYADANRAEVRLITCAGDYDHSAKDYTDNLVVFGHLT
ncbi:class F sortase [Streptomyces sp. MA5143a]|uniref:class F sortase n=1 Tax=Streptomyces sp. MA5143a TaxID=2083010 RepID=UPI000D1BC510|nr:class F sortase [Streptomyces sp. MA5143a]SPE99478.1 sortase [Streptomyces sp. MA5143a]